VSLAFRSISEHLGAALENARLTRENLRITLMNERQMMANEVHDSLAQTLAYMKMRLAMMQEALDGADTGRAQKFAGDMKQALDAAYTGLRALLAQFRNRMDPLGLLHALQTLARDFYDRTGIDLEYENRLVDLNLGVEEEAQVFHIIQEALANVVRHSGATKACLTVDQRGDNYEFSVEDNGKGFFAIGNPLGSFDEHPGLRQHLGVNIMRERAQRVNGRIELANLKRGGARMRLVVPVPVPDGAAR
jgi:two-component system nitrate/nitrite sensor histidine kinase NarX